MQKVRGAGNREHEARSAEQGAQDMQDAQVGAARDDSGGTCVVGWGGVWMRNPGRFIAATLANNLINPVVS